MGRPIAQEARNLFGADVTAMQHGLHFERFKHSHGGQRIRYVAVSIANDANPHSPPPPTPDCCHITAQMSLAALQKKDMWATWRAGVRCKWPPSKGLVN